MYKIWFGLVFAAIVVNPASAQDYQRNFVECVKELGFAPDTGYSHRIQSEGGRVLHKWYLYNEAQAAVLNDCVARKASLASKPSAKGQPRVSR
jgi:hypothetical protein